MKLDIIMSLSEPVRSDVIRRVHDGEMLRLSAERSMNAGEPYMIDDRKLSSMYGETVTVPTERGEMVGLLLTETFAHLGSMHIGPAAVVYIQSSGSIIEAPAQAVRAASEDERKRAEQYVLMADTVQKSQRKVAAQGSASDGRRLDVYLDAARSRGYLVDEAGPFMKVRPSDESSKRCLYLHKNLKRIDLSNYCVDHVLVRAISEDEARERKMGRVRGQALDVPVDSLMEVWVVCLEGLCKSP